MDALAFSRLWNVCLGLETGFPTYILLRNLQRSLHAKNAPLPESIDLPKLYRREFCVASPFGFLTFSNVFRQNHRLGTEVLFIPSQRVCVTTSLVAG